MLVAVLALAACNKSPANGPGEANTPSTGLGVGASLNGRQIFPADNPWNQDVSREPVDPKFYESPGSKI
jgi:hypothetical protein